MIADKTWRRITGAAATSVALFVVMTPIYLAQTTAPAQPPAPAAQAAPNPPPPSVYVNPRSGKDDPRVGLKGGLYDAAEVSFGMEHIATLPKPPGFSPENNATANTANLSNPPGAFGGSGGRGGRGGEGASGGGRGPSIPLGSTNSDMAFSANHLFVGNYNGINMYDIDSPSKIKLKTSLLCPGGQGDVSVYGHLLFMSGEALNGRLDCGTQGVPLPPGYVPPPPPVEAVGATGGRGGSGRGGRGRAMAPPSPDRFRGVRIFDISDSGNPKQVAAVQSCRGSHTHTLVIDPKDKDNVYIYISGTGGVRQEEELAGCSGGDATNPNTALFRIDIIKVPLAHPELAKIVNSPRIFADAQTGALDGLWKGGNHGEGTQTTSATNQCHDITVYSALGLAAGACSGNGILLDISNPVNPVRLAAVSDPNYAFWHSANFSNDGTKLLFTDEWGGGGQARCRDSDPMAWGADAIYVLNNRKLTLASYYKMPAPQTDAENCVAHNGSLVPIPGRDILVQSWYQGGISMMDFTDPYHPFEIAYFDRGPIMEGRLTLGGMWSSYWYNGYIYSSEIARGVDVLRMVPTKYVTQNEIDAANQVHFDELNVQNQPKIVWPQNFIVARAYIDQLARGNSVTPQRIAALNAAIAKAEASPSDKKQAAQLKTMGASLGKDAAGAKTPADKVRMEALTAILK
jgi:hypothetical protein